jgi:site-specific recombinase XerD
MTLLRERMAEDLRIRNYSPRTVECYVSMRSRFAREFGKPPGQLGPAEIRAFQVRLIESKASWTQFNQAACALRFFYRVTLPRDFAVEHIPFAKTKKKLPTVLSVDEVRRLLGAVTNIKHRAVLSLIYATGARLSEATHLQIGDIDGARMTVHIRCGKGGKPRMVPMSAALRELLRAYWLVERPHRQAGERAHAAAQLCDAPAGAGRRLAHDPETARALELVDDGDLRARDRPAARRGEQGAERTAAAALRAGVAADGAALRR